MTKSKRAKKRDEKKRLYHSNAMTCWKKKDYPYKEAAVRMANALMTLKDDNFQLRAYQCLFCKKWHITSKVKKTNKTTSV